MSSSCSGKDSDMGENDDEVKRNTSKNARVIDSEVRGDEDDDEGEISNSASSEDESEGDEDASTESGKDTSDESEGSEYETEEEEETVGERDLQNPVPSSTSSTAKMPKKSRVEIQSDSESETGEICAICLGTIKGEVGSPEMCDHSFCLECLLEWSKTNNSCPQDRLKFFLILVRKRVGGRIIRKETVQEAVPADNISEDEDPIFCEVCGRCDREDTLLLCDGCDSGYHLDCLNPPLDRVPIEEWFCVECQALPGNRRTETDVEDGELNDLLQDAPSLNLSPRRSTFRQPRLLPRTRASERVRQRITRARARETVVEFQELTFSDGYFVEEEENSNIVTSTSTKTSRKPPKPRRKVVKRKVKVKRKRTVKRKSKTRKKTGASKPRRKWKSRKRGKRKGTKRKTRKVQGKKQVNKPVMTPKARLAETLGIQSPKCPWQLSLPVMRGGAGSRVSGSTSAQRWSAGIPTLSLLGSNSALDYVSDNDEIGDAILTAGVRSRYRNTAENLTRRKALSARALLSHAPLTPRKLKVAVDAASSGFDIDNVIALQTRLLGVSQDEDKRNACPFSKIGKGKSPTACGTGSDSPNGEPRGQESSCGFKDSSVPQAGIVASPDRQPLSSSVGYIGGLGFRRASEDDPTGVKAYSSYLQYACDSNVSAERKKKENKESESTKKQEEEDINLYSDIEPEMPKDCDDEESEDEKLSDKPEVDSFPSFYVPDPRNQDHEGEKASSDDEWVIDDSGKADCNKANTSGEKPLPSDYTNEVASSSLPGLNDFELESVSDEDTHEMDKSVNSSISLSDSNVGDAEVTSSTNDRAPIDPCCPPSEQFGHDYRAVGLQPSGNSGMAVGLEGLETETISDNEEMGFEENLDDNMEEGEIPSEMSPRALPLVRPKINIQLKKPVEVASPRREFDGDYEEGEIVDENAQRLKELERRERVRREVKEVVNDLENEGFQQLETAAASPPVVSAVTSSEPVVDHEPSAEVTKIVEQEDKLSKLKEKKDKSNDDKEKNKSKEKFKEKEKDKEKKDRDVSFKKISKNNKVRNYRDNDKENRGRRMFGFDEGIDRTREHGHRIREASREKSRDDKRRNSRRSHRENRKKEPKRKELERYNVREMINKKQEERKKKDEFGRDVALREIRPSRSRSRSRVRRRTASRERRRSRSGSARRFPHSRPRRAKISRSRSVSPKRGRRRRRRRYSSSSTTSSSSSSSTSTSTSSSSYSSSSSSSSPRHNRGAKRRRSKSRSKSLVKKKPTVEKKKVAPRVKEKVRDKTKKPSPLNINKKKKKKEVGVGDKMEKQKKKKKKREKSPLQSKEVYQAGGSIMVSVNFAKSSGKENKEVRKKKDKVITELRKRKVTRPVDVAPSYGNWERQHSVSPAGKRTPLQDEPMWSPEREVTAMCLHDPQTPDIGDMDIIMLTPPPQEPILISDSEDEGITRLPPDLGAPPAHPVRPQGPKTPPEPGVKFTLSSKQVLKPITNPLEDDEEENDSALVPPRGPNTPPGPPPPELDESAGRHKTPTGPVPRSPTGTPPASSPEADVYDPFEPTKSPSPQHSPQQEPSVSSSDQVEILEKSPVCVSSPKATKAPSPPAPPLPADPPETEERPPEPLKPPDDEGTATIHATATVSSSSSLPTTTVVSPSVPVIVSTVPAVATLPAVVPAVTTMNSIPALVTSTAITFPPNPVQQLFSSLPANVANILYPAALAAAVRGAANTFIRPPQPAQGNIIPDFTRPPPSNCLLTRPPPVSSILTGKAGDKVKGLLNGQRASDVIDMDLGSPTSPDSSDASDMFEPPSPHTTHHPDKASPKKGRPQRKVSPAKPVKPMDRFDALFGTDMKRHSGPQKSKGHTSAKLAKLKNLVKKGEINDDDIPSSAVDLQVKEKFIKKVQRQERVVEEVKLCLKPFYNKRTISKENYKEIMRKCVAKVCHNRSGDINPHKIRSLVEGYIKMVKYYRKKDTSTTVISFIPPTASNPPPPGIGLTKLSSASHPKNKA